MYYGIVTRVSHSMIEPNPFVLCIGALLRWKSGSMIGCLFTGLSLWLSWSQTQWVYPDVRRVPF